MQIRNYAQYFSIDESYYPEINPESVKDQGLKWSNTYPHEGFIKFLKAIVKMLRRGKNIDKHDILLHGSFGTGKSRFLWAAQNLLTCSDKDFESYFGSYDALKKESDLKEQLASLRHGKILTAFRYSSGQISTTKDFVMAVYDGISKELAKNGYNTVAEKTIRGSVANRISAELRPVFENCLSLPKYRGLGSIYGKSVDDIVQQLNDTSRSAENLLSDLFKIADDIGVVIYEAKVDFLKEWISEVIDKNELSHIVFIWDEFSSFFRKMKDVLDNLQAFQEIHDRKPFNLIVAVHADYRDGIEGTSVFDRFNKIPVEMPDVVAFDLIHDAIKPIDIPSVKEEYNSLMKYIVEYTNTAISEVCKKTKIDENTMKSILPIHPMAALMLKYISVEFASNQRSMFNFIKNDSDDDEMHAFQWFIKNRSPENGDILTIDYLWDFFYISGTDENSNVTGRNNLSRAIANILDTYTVNEDRLDSDSEKRVLKTVLMMQAISRKQQHSLELLRPTAANIKLAFEGDGSLEGDLAVNIINNNLINQKHILYRNESGRQTLFEADINSGDQTKIDEIESRLRRDTKTEKLVSNADLISAFKFSESLKSRFDFSSFATIDNIGSVLGKAFAEERKYKFKVIVCFARNEDEQEKLRNKIDVYLNDEKYKDIIFIDATACQLGNDAFDMWIKISALEENFRLSDPSLADNKAKEASDGLKTWKAKISSGNFRILKGNSYKRNCGSLDILKSTLSEYVLSVYPLTFDNFSITNTIFTNINYVASAKYGLESSKGGVFQEKDVNLLLGEVRNAKEYWKHYSENSLSKLKIKLNSLIDKHLNKERRISISDIVGLLLENGFIPSALYAYLTGFLLRDYSGEPYRYSEGIQGDNGGLMSKDKLGTMIGECFKHLLNPNIRNYKEQYIEVISDEQSAFIDFVKKTFGISEALVVESAATKLRTYYKNRIRYPVWCFKTIMDFELEEPMQLVSDIMYTESSETVPSLAEKLGKILIYSSDISEKLSSLLTPDNAKKAMMKFIETFEDGELPKYSKMIGVSNVLDDIAGYVVSDAKSYLFDQSEGEEQLRKLLVDYKIIYESNDILDVKASSVSGLMSNYRNYIKTLKLPFNVLKENCKDIEFFLKCMMEVEKNSLISDEKKEAFLAELSGKKDSIRDLSRRIEEIYKLKYSIYTDGLDDNELKDVIAKIPFVFLSSISDFQGKLKSLTDDKKKDQAKTKLNELWNKLTDSKSPADWSIRHKTPIKIMLTKSESSLAESVFKAFRFGERDINVINDALSYLETEPDFIKRLKNQDELDDAFRSKVLDRYSVILYDLDNVRNYIIDHCDVEPVDWYGSASVQHIIKELAELKYYNEVNEGVMDRIDDMSPEDAKQYLKDLAQNDVEVGISIITKGGN